jgi:hypothetical protein
MGNRWITVGSWAEWSAIGYMLLGCVVGWTIHGAPVEPRAEHREPPPPQYLEGDPRSQVTINSRLETQIASHDEGLTALELRLDREQKRIDELELRVRGMQQGIELRVRAEQRKDAGK